MKIQLATKEFGRVTKWNVNILCINCVCVGEAVKFIEWYVKPSLSSLRKECNYTTTVKTKPVLGKPGSLQNVDILKPKYDLILHLKFNDLILHLIDFNHGEVGCENIQSEITNMIRWFVYDY